MQSDLLIRGVPARRENCTLLVPSPFESKGRSGTLANRPAALGRSAFAKSHSTERLPDAYSTFHISARVLI